jgi:hypothetical protein
VLQVGGEQFLVCRDMPTLIVMMSAATVLYTLVINAWSMKLVMSKLGLTELTEVRDAHQGRPQPHRLNATPARHTTHAASHH